MHKSWFHKLGRFRVYSDIDTRGWGAAFVVSSSMLFAVFLCVVVEVHWTDDI